MCLWQKCSGMYMYIACLLHRLICCIFCDIFLICICNHSMWSVHIGVVDKIAWSRYIYCNKVLPSIIPSLLSFMNFFIGCLLSVSPVFTKEYIIIESHCFTVIHSCFLSELQWRALSFLTIRQVIRATHSTHLLTTHMLFHMNWYVRNSIRLILTLTY